jgi:hypothetical protein
MIQQILPIMMTVVTRITVTKRRRWWCTQISDMGNRKDKVFTFLLLKVMTTTHRHWTQIIFTNSKSWTRINMAGALEDILQKRFISEEQSQGNYFVGTRDLTAIASRTRTTKRCILALLPLRIKHRALFWVHQVPKWFLKPPYLLNTIPIFKDSLVLIRTMLYR